MGILAEHINLLIYFSTFLPFVGLVCCFWFSTKRGVEPMASVTTLEARFGYTTTVIQDETSSQS